MAKLRIAVGIAACLAALWPLLDFKFVFGADWPNHLWIAAYQTEFFRFHHYFPGVFNTPQLSGIPFGVFYGFFLFPLVSLLALVTGADASFRIVIIVITLVRFFVTEKTVRAFIGDRKIAAAVAVLVTWAIYPMTNLYNRSDLPEYCATALLHIAVCLFLLMARQGAGWTLVFFTGLVSAAVLGSHPITAATGLPFLAIAALWTFLAAPPDRKAVTRKYIAGIVIFCAVAAAPWIYATVKFARSTALAEAAKHILFYKDLDTFWARIMPFPFDGRTAGKTGAELLNVSNPYLDTQINIPIFIVAVAVIAFAWTSVKKPPKTALAFMLLFFVCLAFSSFESLWDFVPEPLHLVEMAYRLVTYCDLSLFLALIAGLGFLNSKNVRPERIFHAVVAAALALSFVSVVVKIPRAKIIANEFQKAPLPFLADRENAVNLPSTFYGGWDFFTPALFPDAALLPENTPRGTVDFGVYGGTDFGAPGPLRMSPTFKALAVFNVEAFPWNKILLDGKETGDVYRADDKLAVLMNPGSYEASYVFVPDFAWEFLRRMSYVAVALWLIAGGVTWILPRVKLKAPVKRRL